jgi:hypothetical protein
MDVASPQASRRNAMFLFNRSALSVVLALGVAGAPVLLEYFGYLGAA